MRKILLVILFINFAHLLQAQQQQGSSFYFLNPAFLNPAGAGEGEVPVVYMNHRQQWWGIEGAPMISSLSFHMPLKKKLAVGVNLVNDKRSVFNSSYAHAFSAYKLNITRRKYLKFGLGIGMSNNLLLGSDFNGIEDPAVQKALNEGDIRLMGNFGMLLKTEKLQLGLVLPRLFAPVFEEGQQATAFAPFKNLIVSAAYQFELVKGSWNFTPAVNYHIMEQGEGIIEVSPTLYYKDNLWGGATYRQGQGVTPFVGAKLKDRYGFSYAFEMPVEGMNAMLAGSHELNISILLGKPKKKKKLSGFAARRRAILAQKRKEALKEKEAQEQLEKQKAAEAEEENPLMPDETQQKEEPNPLMPDEPEEDVALEEKQEEGQDDVLYFQPPAEEEETREEDKRKNVPRFEQKINQDLLNIGKEEEPEPEVEAPVSALQLQKGYYVVLKEFDSFEEAAAYSDELFGQGYETKYGFNKELDKYFVYLLKSESEEEAGMMLNSYKQVFNSAFMLEVE